MPTRNRLLALMAPEDRAAILENSTPVNLSVRQKLEEPFRSPPYVYFFETGLASLLYKGRGDFTAEVALVGPEGCTGCGVILGANVSPQGISVQVAGLAHRIATDVLSAILRRQPVLHHMLLLFVYTQLVQRDETALAASKGKLIERLARWLLMVGDRLQTNEIPLTHDVIAMMLSTRRAGVTTALGELRAQGIIDLARGHIGILDRPRLVAIAGEYYGGSEGEYHRLIEMAAAPAVVDRQAPPQRQRI